MPSEPVLVDTGPLVAILNAQDQHHAVCVEALESLRNSLFIVWPCITEAMHLLQRSPRAQQALLQLLEAGSLLPLDFGTPELPRIRELMGKYADLPMDFADAVSVAVAERDNISTVFTVDSDFRHYRPRHAKAFKIIPAR